MFSELVVAYLFLGGAGAGCSFVCCVLGLLSEPKQLEDILRANMRISSALPWVKFFAAGFGASLATLIIGSLCLVADLGKPQQILMVLFQPSFTYINLGAWSIIFCITLSLILLFIWLGFVHVGKRALQIFEALTLIASGSVMLYTGLMLSEIQAVPIWNTSWIAILFVVSALSCGIAVFVCSSIVVGVTHQFRTVLARLAYVDAALIIAEMIIAMLCMVSVWVSATGSVESGSATGMAAIASLNNILAGSLAVAFWLGFFGIGMVVPLIQDIIIARNNGESQLGTQSYTRLILMLSTSLCVLIGGVFLRFIVVESALHPMMGFIG